MNARRRSPKSELGMAGLSGGAIRHYRLLLVAVVGLLLVAGLAWSRIPRLEDPLTQPPIVVVTIPYAGASAEDVDAQLLRPVEEVLFGMDDLEFIESKAVPNAAIISMHFGYGAPIDTVTETVRGKVQGIRKQLPAEVGDPLVNRVKVSTYIATMVLAVTGNRSEAVLNETARRVKDDLLAVPGVATVSLRGGRARAVRVRLDPVRLAEQHLTVDQITERVKLSNVRIPAGEVPVGSLITLLTVSHELEDAAGVARIPVGSTTDRDGSSRTITLGDVAEVRDDFRSATERMLDDGIPSVGLEVRFRPGENAVDVGRRVRAMVDEKSATMPQGVTLKIAHSQPEWVETSLSTFLESLLEGVALVMFVITLGMGWRAAMVVAMVLPLAMAGGIIGLYGLGMSLDQISIAGLIVALGLLVDDAVVVAESIQLLRDRGLGKVRAAILGTARVFWANNGTTAVACASFIPLFLVGGDSGPFIRGMPTAVLLALITSLLVAQLLTPWLATLLLKIPKGVPEIPDGVFFDRKQDLAHEERNVVLRAMRALYGYVIPRVIRHPVKVILLATAMLAGACMLLPKVGMQFFPKADKPALFVSVELTRGTDEGVTAMKVAEVVAELRKDPAVRATSAVIGGPYPTIFLGRAARPASKDAGDILVKLTEPSDDALVSRLRASLAKIPGAKITVQELYQGPPLEHPVVVRVQGDDPAELLHYAERIKGLLRGVPGAINVADTMSESIPLASVEIDADRALRLGITPAQVGSALRSVYGEDKVTSFRQERETVEVVIEGPEAERPIDAARETPVPAVNGATVPLLAVGDVAVSHGFAELRRRDTRRIVEISADVAGSSLPSKVLAQLQPHLDAMEWKNGYSYAFGGEQTEAEKGFRSLTFAGLVTLLIIFVLLVWMFGSLTRAAIVLGAVPFALIGAIPGLYLTGNAFGFMAFLGLIALIGVYVNHKIYFVDRMNELLSRGVDWPSAIRQAGIDRLRPVVLTALTAILGLLPLTVGSGTLWSSFGWLNVFGLAVSIPLSLILLPAFLAVSFRVRAPKTEHVDDRLSIQDETLMMVRPVLAQRPVVRAAPAPAAAPPTASPTAPKGPLNLLDDWEEPGSTRVMTASERPPRKREPGDEWDDGGSTRVMTPSERPTHPRDVDEDRDSMPTRVMTPSERPPRTQRMPDAKSDPPPRVVPTTRWRGDA